METSPASWLQKLTRLPFSSKLLPPLSLQEGGFYACSLLSHWIFHKNAAFSPPSRQTLLTFSRKRSHFHALVLFISVIFRVFVSVLRSPLIHPLHHWLIFSFSFFFKYCIALSLTQALSLPSFSLLSLLICSHPTPVSLSLPNKLYFFFFVNVN